MPQRKFNVRVELKRNMKFNIIIRRKEMWEQRFSKKLSGIWKTPEKNVYDVQNVRGEKVHEFLYYYLLIY